MFMLKPLESSTSRSVKEEDRKFDRCSQWTYGRSPHPFHELIISRFLCMTAALIRFLEFDYRHFVSFRFVTVAKTFTPHGYRVL